MLSQGTQEPIRKMGITSLTDDTCEPQAAGDHQSQSIQTTIPRAFTRIHVGLNMHRLELFVFKERMVDSFTKLPRTISPRSYRAFIQTIGLHNGLDRTPKSSEGQHNDHQLGRRAQYAQPSFRDEHERFDHRCDIGSAVVCDRESS